LDSCARLYLWGVSLRVQVHMGVAREDFLHRSRVETMRRIAAFFPSRKQDLYLGGLFQMPPYVGVMKTHVLGQKCEFSPG
jgi:hypothetical protein